jgi:exonuclease III
MTQTPFRPVHSLADLLPVDPETDHAGLNEIDPDLNLIPSRQSNYYNINDFCNLLNHQQRPSLSFLSHNIRGAHINLTDLLNFFAPIENDFHFSIIALSETWFGPHNCTAFNPPNYQGAHNTRTNRTRGGVSIFVHESLSFKRRDDLSLLTDSIECLFVETSDPFSIPLVGVIYRPPGADVHCFLDELNSITRSVSSEKKAAYIMGDFNLNLLHRGADNRVQEFLDSMHSHSFFQCIHKPICITPYSSTLIDNIFTNSLSSTLTSGCFYTDISDHLPTFLLVHDTNTAKPNKITIKQRILSQANKAAFSAALSQSP